MRYVWGAVKAEERRKKREAPISILVLHSYETGPDPAWLKYQQEISASLLVLLKRLPEEM